MRGSFFGCSKLGSVITVRPPNPLPRRRGRGDKSPVFVLVHVVILVLVFCFLTPASRLRPTDFHHLAQDEVGCRAGGIGVLRFAQDVSSQRQRGDHQAVPTGEDFLIATRPDAFRSHVEELLSAGRKHGFELCGIDLQLRCRIGVRDRSVEDVRVFPVASRGDVVAELEGG